MEVPLVVGIASVMYPKLVKVLRRQVDNRWAGDRGIMGVYWCHLLSSIRSTLMGNLWLLLTVRESY
jgi:hypothetical protein